MPHEAPPLPNQELQRYYLCPAQYIIDKTIQRRAMGDEIIVWKELVDRVYEVSKCFGISRNAFMIDTKRVKSQSVSKSNNKT